jgi:hypothetical protein
VDHPDEEHKPEVIVDDCRGDDKFRCGKTSVFICEIQKCDGSKNCPNGEDEENCPNLDSGSETIEGSGGVEEVEIVHPDEAPSSTTEHVPIIEDDSEEEIDTKSDDDKTGDFFILINFVL